MTKRDRLTLEPFGIAARVIQNLKKTEMGRINTASWAYMTPSREMKRIIRTAFGK